MLITIKMIKRCLTVVILMFSVASWAQINETTYYKDQYHRNETTAEKARFSKTVMQNADGSITTESKDLKKGQIVWSHTYKGEEPVGTWIMDGKVDKDWDFDLVYAQEDCSNNVVKTKSYFENNDSLYYAAPVIEGSESFIKYVQRNLRYPSYARRHGVDGKVYVAFTITKEGTIENIVVTKGVHVSLDKETVRLFRNLKLLSPPKLNGQPVAICIAIPLRFKLDV